MSPILRKALRLLGFGVYALAAAALFVVSGYAAFNLFVRSGATRVPALAGLAREEARDRLADSGLRLETSADNGRWDPRVPAGHVLEQEPAANTLVKRGSAVSAVLSLGPQRLRVPDLAGRSLQSAQVALAASDLTLGRALRVFTAGATAGTVVGQQPSAGALVPPSGEVELFLAQPGSATTYVMPDLVYRDYDDVRRFFERAGLRLGRVTFEIYEGAREGTILRQFPLAGHPLTRNDAVSLVVATLRSESDDTGDGAAPTPRPEGIP